jgi:hypothetical protein
MWAPKTGDGRDLCSQQLDWRGIDDLIKFTEIGNIDRDKSCHYVEGGEKRTIGAQHGGSMPTLELTMFFLPILETEGDR